ncbi:hypothetical protein [Ottowia sp.]|uniref:hypothetical protein n=1 Tax=Ottowia sp. TaxID=1898956 RepID=UPI002C885288|nr:hypothetical protein [Ottowia sp.]HOB67829.1 hypothetical protein [Ottowia sp.]HPZ58309.1 hypothetical protein [Ottowia sp.]HQD48605.1 hypothetical protein [Ottowia sp.]
MRAIKEARRYIERKPDDAHAKTLSRLVLALESEADFAIADLYKLDLARFKLALEILDEWRLDRHYASKSKLFDVSLQLAVLKPAEAAQPPDAPAAGNGNKSEKKDKPAKEDKPAKDK